MKIIIQTLATEAKSITSDKKTYQEVFTDSVNHYADSIEDTKEYHAFLDLAKSYDDYLGEELLIAV